MKNQNKKHQKVNEKTLIVAVDMGKLIPTGYCRCPDGNELKPFEFFNNGRGFETFWQRVRQFQKAHGLEEVVVGLESTGCYGEPLVHWLIKRGVRVVQVNPLHTKRLKELQGNSPNKTDKKDPRVIADIIELGHALSVVVPKGAAAELRRLTQARERAIQRRTAAFNQLGGLVFLVFPEFLEVMKDVKSKTAQYLLKHFPTPQQLLDLGLEELTLRLKKISRGKLGKARAQALYEASGQSVGLQQGQTSLLVEIQELLVLIEASERFMAQLEEQMSSYLKQIAYSRYLLSFKGIGTVTVAGIIGEVGDFNQFQTISELEKLAGLDLYELSSGQHRGQRRISKRGRALLRKLLFFAALNVVRKGGIFHDWYQKALGRGMLRKKALVAVARKLLRIMLALVRDHQEFDKDYSKTQNLKLAA